MHGSTQEQSDRVMQVMNTHGAMIYRLVFARVLNRPDAEDIFQEVILRWVLHDAPFESSEHEKAWLIRVACNLSTNIVKSAWRRHTTSMKQELSEGTYEVSLDNLALYEAMTRLDQKYRAPIHLFYFEDMTVDEIAHILQRKASTVRAQLTRGRDKLKRYLLEGGYEEWA